MKGKEGGGDKREGGEDRGGSGMVRGWGRERTGWGGGGRRPKEKAKMRDEREIGEEISKAS